MPMEATNRIFRFDFAAIDAAAQGRAARRIEPAITHMLQHADEPLRVSTLSAIAGISGSHFFALFKSVTGLTPIGYFNRLRMQRACALLHDPGLSIKEIASRLGYDDPFYFSRVFKLVTGMAPRNYSRMVLADGRKKSEVAALTGRPVN